jgi:hypothetical protein
MELNTLAWLTAIATIVGLLALCLIVDVLIHGGNLARIGLAWRAFRRVLHNTTFADQVQAVLTPPPPKPEVPPKPSGAPLRLLALLQRDGRLVDFLLEDVQAYPDAQIGAAVRDIHRQCQAALKEHLDMSPVMPQPEGSSVEVPSGFDPSAIRLTGNVTGQPPFRGTLQHHGWRVKEIKLAPFPEGQDEFVLQPAEVELP